MTNERETQTRTGYFHVRKEDVHQGSAAERNPPFASFDVVLRRDYDRAVDALRAILAVRLDETLTPERAQSQARIRMRDIAEAALRNAPTT